MEFEYLIHLLEKKVSSQEFTSFLIENFFQEGVADACSISLKKRGISIVFVESFVRQVKLYGKENKENYTMYQYSLLNGLTMKSTKSLVKESLGESKKVFPEEEYSKWIDGPIGERFIYSYGEYSVFFQFAPKTECLEVVIIQKN